MTEPTEAQKMLDKLEHGTPIKLTLEDGSEVKGTFDGRTEEGHVLVGGTDAGLGIPTDRVKTVAMELSSQGPE